MPLDPRTGVFFALHGPEHGRPLMITLPLMASFGEIFGAELAPVLTGYLERLTDRYRVLLLDYPSIGRSRDIVPGALTADRVCADLLGVADAAGCERFAYWGYSWGGNVGLQLATRTGRLTALVVGGWPALGAPYAELLQAAQRKLPNPEPSSLKVLRSPAQYAQWIHYGQSIAAWPERESVSRIACPRMNVFGGEGDLVEAGIAVSIATRIRAHRTELEAMGWRVHEMAGHGHGACLQPEVVVPPVRGFLDEVLA
ncbi:MAG: alpha/beta fold hydrolase [Betaproteobacteria bacterium]|jgi:pimeloyl-ACP methyl ester carboxylesterase|nr:alpha/beta hydrolase [Rubrivivax sp.]